MKHSKSSLFLMELIVAILFFSLASAVCIRLFVKAHLISRETIEQNHAITITQNFAECMYATDCNLTKMQTLFENSLLSETNGSLTLYYDRDWNPVAPANTGAAAYIAAFTAGKPVSDNGMVLADISISSYSENAPGREIYQIQIRHHVPFINDSRPETDENKEATDHE